VQRTVIVGTVTIGLFLGACSSSAPASPATIAAAQRNVAKWQSLVNQDQAQLSQAEGCPLSSAGTGCIPQTNRGPTVAQDQAKLKADESKLFSAEDTLQRDENE
jgi:hypothetical protein